MNAVSRCIRPEREPRRSPRPAAPGTTTSSGSSPTTSPSRPSRPGFDKDWSPARLPRDRAAQRRRLGRGQKVEGLKLEIVRLEGRTPVLFFEVPRPPAATMTRDRADVRPPRQAARVHRLAQRPRPVDAASTRTASSTAAAAPTTATRCTPASPRCRRSRRRASPHPRIVGLIETCEESGSYDLLPYVDALRAAAGRRRPGDLPRLGRRQLRPAVAHDLAARHGQRHAEGRDPDRRRALGRRLGPGAVELPHHAAGARPPGGQQDRPPAAGELPLRGAGRAAGAGQGHGRDPRRRGLQALPVGALRLRRLDQLRAADHHRPGARRCSTAPGSRRCRSPAPKASRRCKDAGNVLRPYTAFKLSLRLPPLVDADEAVQELKALLEDNAPYQAKVTFEQAAARRHRLERADHRAVVRAAR